MGFGDDLMTTAKARQAKKSHPHHKILIGDGKREYLSPIFWHNPYIDHLAFTKPTDKVLWIRDYPGHRPYLDCQKSTHARQVFKKCRASPGNIFFTSQEIEKAKKALGNIRSFIVIEPNVGQKLFVKNKAWGFHKWQRVVDELSTRIRFVQLGNRRSKTLKGVTRLFTNNFRQACAILSFAKLFAGAEGGLHHAAAAVGIPGVILFGGRISPKTTGYRLHTNLYVDHPKSPCGMLSPCNHCKQCMDKISIQEVIDAILFHHSSFTPDKIPMLNNNEVKNL